MREPCWGDAKSYRCAHIWERSKTSQRVHILGATSTRACGTCTCFLKRQMIMTFRVAGMMLRVGRTRLRVTCTMLRVLSAKFHRCQRKVTSCGHDVLLARCYVFWAPCYVLCARYYVLCVQGLNMLFFVLCNSPANRQ